ncbi:MAG: putative acetyltransferase [Thermoleophilia bacterium]|nr:putative acetyltransferase [Thermoleophilia bacterium]
MTEAATELVVRRATIGDADAMIAFAERNAEFLRPFEPVRSAGRSTADQLRERLTATLPNGQIAHMPYLAWMGEELVATVNVSNIVRGAFQSAHLGYAVDAAWNGQGVATAAVAATVHDAFTTLRLHRLEAGTLLDNHASQRVLEKNGFTRIGISPGHLQIAGAWQDHVLYARVNDALSPVQLAGN